MEENIIKIFADFFNFQSCIGKKYIEIRFIKTLNGVVSGIFEATDEGAAALMAEIQRLGLEKYSMYHTINILSSDYVNNFTKQYKLNVLYTNMKSTTKDADISRLRLIMLDFDPKRPTNTSSTDVEKSKTYECMQNVLSEIGTEHIAYTTDSGNGYNAYVLVDFPNDKEHNKLIADFIDVLHSKFSNEAVDVDRSTKNLARIAKVCGSWSCKGDNTEERPHRICQFLTTNRDAKPMAEEQLSKFIEAHKPKKKAKGKVKKVKVADVASWLNHHSLEYQVKDSEFDGKPTTMYLLKDCPFAEHDNKFCSFIVQFSDRSIIFKCHHDHCTQNIHDFIARYPLTKQIPLISGDSDKAILYNAVVLNSKLLQDCNKQPHIMVGNKVIRFETAESGKAISKIALSVGVLPSSTTLNSVIASVSTLFDDFAKPAPIGTRIVHEGNDYYYALTPNKFVHICNGMAEITDKVPVYFAYNPQFLEQVTPDLNTPATALPSLIDEVFSISHYNKSRFIAQLCGFFMPNLPTPILVLSGGHGTSKTTTARKIISLVDPKPVDIMSIPDKEDGLTAILASNYISVLDNVANISQTFSDILCIACTGGFTAKRKLYTDNTLVSAPLKSHVILNGIGDFINRPDLAERSNIIYLDPITKRLTEKQVWSKFNSLKPQILGSIFNTIAKGLTLVDSCEAVADLPRMADFAQYGAAFVAAVGLDFGEFINEYQQTNTQLLADCNCSDPFISSICDFVESQNDTWTGTAAELLEKLGSFTSMAHSAISKFTPSSLSRKLNQCITDLKAVGISVEIKQTTPKSITLTADGNDGIDGISF